MKPFLLTCSTLLGTALLGVALLAVREPVVAGTAANTSATLNDGSSRYNLLGVSFATPEPLSTPVAIRKGVGVLYPATATPGNEEFRITLMDLPPGDVVVDGMNDTEVAQWVRFVVLGNNRPVDGRIERTILGRRLIGDVQLQRSRRQTVEEIYLLPLSTGHRLVVSFESDQRLPLQQMERLISSIAASMQELPARSPEWRESFRWQKRKQD